MRWEMQLLSVTVQRGNSEMYRRIAMAGWLHGIFVGEWLFVFQLFDFSLSLFCNYRRGGQVISREQGLRYDVGFAVPVLMS